jgi:cytochrome P450
MTIKADFTSQEYFRNPAAEIAKLRAAGRVVEVRFPLVGTIWTPTTQDLANQVLRDSQTFTVRKEDGEVVGLQWWMPKIVRTISNNMLSADEPDHTRLRGIVDEAFRRQAVLDMEPRILALAGELADAKVAAFGDLRTSWVASRRPAEVHGLGQRLNPFHGALESPRRRSEDSSHETLYGGASRGHV